MDNKASNAASAYDGYHQDLDQPDNGPVCRFANEIREEGRRQIADYGSRGADEQVEVTVTR